MGSTASSRLRQSEKREATILERARILFLADGYHGLTMERIATECGLAKGTLYHVFACKEEVIIALADTALRRRSALMRRGLAFQGNSRERMQALGEAVGLFAQLYSGDSRIIHSAMGPLREKTPELRLRSLEQAEHEALTIVREVIQAAIAVGELSLRAELSVDEFLLGTWGLVDGAHALIESGASSSLGLDDAFDAVWRYWHLAVDGLGWRPLFAEFDYAESLARARREVFPDEARALFGDGWGVKRGKRRS